MSRDPRGWLAVTLGEWMKRQRVGNAHIHRYGRIAVNTLRLIENGTTRRPRPGTLPRIARGIATSAYSPHARDDQIEMSCRRDLEMASVYEESSTFRPDTLLEIGLYGAVGSVERALAWAEVIRELARLSPAQLRELRAEAARRWRADEGGCGGGA